LFLSRSDPGGHWTKPVNLGYPINTFHDEIGLSVNAAGDRAFFASDRKGREDTDLYTFELPPAIRPVQVSYMKGRIFDSSNMKGVPAGMELIDLGSGEVVLEMGTDTDGSYLLSLPAGRDYALNVSAAGYLFYSEHFAFSGNHSRADPMRRDIPLERIETGNRVVLNNVFYEVDSYRLASESMAELNKVARFLLENPGLTVEIGGHTDNTGTPEYNMVLSEQRAGAVVDYLVEQGVPRETLKGKGYGETLPVGDNSVEEGRAMNRRTELRILQIQRN
jgi:outer membrane protein OmpA-like peptidoglycan-associated protein